LAALSILSTRPKRSNTRLTRSSKIFKTIIQSIQSKKGEHIVSLDLRKIPEAVADFFIICVASSKTQVKAIADFIADEVKIHCQENPFHHEGGQTAQWVLIDYVNVVVHVFLPEARKFYRLEEMWSDAPQAEHAG
jgi:ribosome-associated protein